MGRAPVTSVVTPFYNTASYLEECIQSVLAQSAGDFEYLLVNNKSTDGSREIAARYAALDPRIRLIDNEEFVGQVENYNGALSQIHEGCRYVKLVQADDTIFPTCLEAMVAVAEQHPSVGLVSSYHIEGGELLGAGIPYGQTLEAGRKMCRRLLMDGVYPFGSPTTVLYRASVVRSRQPFFALGRFHEDSEAHVEILLDHDLGFAHQVLSYMRVREESLMSAARRFNPVPLDHLILLTNYGSRVLDPGELDAQLEMEWRRYLGMLGESVLHGRSEEFWDYHRRGLATIRYELTRRDLTVATAKQLARWALNPLQLPNRLRQRRSLLRR